MTTDSEFYQLLHEGNRSLYHHETDTTDISPRSSVSVSKQTFLPHPQTAHNYTHRGRHLGNVREVVLLRAEPCIGHQLGNTATNDLPPPPPSPPPPHPPPLLTSQLTPATREDAAPGPNRNPPGNPTREAISLKSYTYQCTCVCVCV